MKNKLLIALSSLLVLGLVTGCGCNKKEKSQINNDKEIYNTNKGVIEEKKVEELTLTNTSLVSAKKSSTLETTVSNNSNKDVKVKEFDIIVKDKNNNIIIKLKGYVGETLLKGESRKITSNVDINLEKAAKVEYKLIK